MTTRSPARPRVIVLDHVFDDTAWLRDQFAAHGPYWNQGRYLSAAGAASQMPGNVGSTVGVPWYRQDWALGGVAFVPTAERLLAHDGFAIAARTVFDGAVVRPHTVYANVQLPATGTDFGHVDVPEFRGATRDRYPVALLHLMNRSELFVDWQLDICTAVTWVWDGPRGDFVLWPHGPEEAPTRFPPPLTGRAVVCDNDRLFHAVGDFASPDGPTSNLLTPTSEVRVNGDAFELCEGQAVVGRWGSRSVRCSVSWKAYVFHDERAARSHEEHLDDLDETTLLRVFAEELDRRGAMLPDPFVIDDPLIATLASIWPKRVPRQE